MQVTASNSTKVFLPVTLEITMETQEELDAFGSFFNSTCIGQGLSAALGTPENMVAPRSIYGALENAGANIHTNINIISQAVQGE